MKSVVRQKMESMLNTLAVLEKMESLIDPVYWPGISEGQIQFWPADTEASRRLVGGCVRLFKTKPSIRKWAATELEATFVYAGVNVVINRYRGRKCAVTVKTIVHEAVPEKIVPAKEAWVETVEELVCEMPDVEAEVTPTTSEVLAEAEVAEVPF